uniref:Uncharacterized protein n=1 Tax=viral metagenome TaxID=1070528 RepID=A0A6H2A663_9ZZZZ
MQWTHAAERVLEAEAMVDGVHALTKGGDIVAFAIRDYSTRLRSAAPVWRVLMARGPRLLAPVWDDLGTAKRAAERVAERELEDEVMDRR